mmetsp:Transcript_8122/g.21661  ORF Transcript_8122/g.21661 Transcript_8122/m.21661 type:complete len:927 (-) Transcript_8122:280-3060(-)|eukprot:CAMPEP_0202349120 /NCGR_PEP_ID=MMETSP1126-20121109/6748_1 /ASSEMBLY_ACC=CAM_ASM_000457 /TAXON_ID=3047 /ORGANISM="Dunaliella tertiolecta, Strain CCMP1320" /LENGTH=926 /DNA_ID=CAMNT_0048940885 /DNA_START=86 /DNA_END=2866 /DNA_ORIENTATION=+
MSDGKYFSTTKKGEIHELKEELRSLDRIRKKESVKKVIAAMTVGKDVSMLFPDVVNCMQTEDLELKKLVYLYLINYAKTQPDLAIMAVNTFVKDSQDPNPLIRALAVRTMGCIRVDKITEYLCDPLGRCLKDEDPYVRKTAAVCVAKLYDINPELVDDRGFLDMLRDMLSDANPMVVANALACLQELQELSGRDMLHLNSQTLYKLLPALNECTEWGQVFILDALAAYRCQTTKEAENIAERVMPRLQHVNSAVVLSAIKVLFHLMDYINEGNPAYEDTVKLWCKKMAPPLVTLLGSEPEVQYVALRNINLIIQKRPSILANEVKVFFCKYNDPIYVKLEKLEIMIKLASEKNIDQVLLEFKEYAQEVDVDFVRKAVRAIGRCAVILERAAEKCINVLLELIQTKVNYVVQEAIIVIKDIFRRYPNQYESIIATLCENLESLDEPEAKASMIWIIGEYAERIDNADELLESFLETFPEETSIVQLQLLTATVKLFLKRPNELAQKVISLVLSCATTETDNPDLRDRAYIYWRLLSTDPEAAKDVVLCEKPVITDDSSNLDPLLLHKLLGQISTLASVYHKPADSFVSRQRIAVQKADELQGHTFEEDSQPQGAGLEHSPSGHAISPSDGSVSATAPTASTTAAASMMGDLLDMSDGAPPAGAAPPGKQAGDIDDLLGGLDIASGPPAAPATAPPPLPLLLQDPSRGVAIGGQLVRHAGGLSYHISITNTGAVPLSGFMIQTNKNSFGITPANQVLDLGVVPPGASSHTHCPLTYDAAKLVPGPANAELQVAIKTEQVGVLFIKDMVRLEGLLEESGAIDGASFLAAWKALPAEKQQRLTGLLVQDLEWAKAKLHAANLFVLAHRPVPSTPQQALYLTGRVAGPGGAQVMLELRLVPGQPGIDASFKSEKADLAQMAFAAVQAVLSI